MEEIKIEAKPDQPEQQAKAPAKKRKIWPLIVLLILVILGGGAVFGYYGGYYDKYFKKSAKEEPKKTEEKAKEKTGEVAKTDKVVDEGVTWTTPKKLDDLGLFMKAENIEDMMGGYDGTNYYLVGKTASGYDIISAFPIAFPEVGDVFRIIKKGDKYYKVDKNSKYVNSDFYYTDSSKGVETDNETVFKSLLPDQVVVNGDTESTYSYTGDITLAEGSTDGSKLAETNWGDLYIEYGSEINKSTEFKIAKYYIKLNDGSRAYYAPKPSFYKDDKTFDLTWTNDKGKTATFEKMHTSGCGSGTGSFPTIYSKEALAGKEAIAKKDGKDILYTFTDPTNALIKFGFDVYQMDGLAGKDTIEQFASNLGIVFWIDGYGSAIIYSNTKYVPLAECGKPVIYLYPEKDTNVSVKVGANITKSEPAYQNGWSVLAKKNGSLVLGGQNYPYLFWEGTGVGKYPTITSGTVVAGDQAAATITSQLSAMGLNNKEIADFNEFWLPKLPKTPYVRLSWLTTEEMNMLAPLAVSPKPDSVLRVFLDFQGLSSYQNIPAQILPKFERKGFSLVEWGGLLRTAK